MKSSLSITSRLAFGALTISYFMTQPASALCVIGNSVLPLALLGSQVEKQPSGKGKKYYDPDKACEEEKKNETTSSEWYRGDFYGLDDD